MNRLRDTTLHLALAAGFACLALVASQCSRESGDEQATDSHGHGSDEHEEHGDAHDSSSLGSVTMAPEALTENGVVIGRTAPGVVNVEVDLPGEIVLNADRVVHVVPRFAGIVQKVNKNLGDAVRAGEVLAVIQSNVSAAPYDVVSLVDGTVIEKHAALGEFVRDDSDIFVVADLSTVWVNVSVYARFLAEVKRGQKVRLTSPGLRETATGTIDYVSPIVGESTRTGVARIVLPNPGRTWQPGLFVTAHITVSEAKVAVAVPDGAVQTIEGREVVFVRSMNTFTARLVTTGRRSHDLVEILEGLSPGEDYVADGSFIFKAELGKSEAGHEH